jgi:hypothetical protein
MSLATPGLDAAAAIAIATAARINLVFHNYFGF